MKRVLDILLRYLVAAFALLFLWQIGAWALGPYLLPAPLDVLEAWAQAMRGPDLPMHIRSSALRVLAAMALAWVVAFPLGKRFRAVRVHTSFASVSARELKADVCTLDSMSGSIFADEIEASQLIGKSVSGSIRMEDACVRTLRLTTVNGAIDYAVLYNAALTVEQLSADSVGGNVSFAFPAKSSFALRYHTAGGQFCDAFGAAYADGAYVAGAGSASVRVRTVTGSLTIEKRG